MSIFYPGSTNSDLEAKKLKELLFVTYNTDYE